MPYPPLYFIWHTELETGIPILDEQHRGIIATLNSLHYFIQQGHGLDALQPTISIMKQYIGFHLKTEEMILAEHQFTEIDAHREMQLTVLHQFNQTARQATQYRDSELLLTFIRDWWLQHIKEEHLQYQVVFPLAQS